MQLAAEQEARSRRGDASQENSRLGLIHLGGARVAPMHVHCGITCVKPAQCVIGRSHIPTVVLPGIVSRVGIGIERLDSYVLWAWVRHMPRAPFAGCRKEQSLPPSTPLPHKCKLEQRDSSFHNSYRLDAGSEGEGLGAHCALLQTSALILTGLGVPRAKHAEFWEGRTWASTAASALGQMESARLELRKGTN